MKEGCLLSQELNRSARLARRRSTLWSFSQLMVLAITSPASNALTANPGFRYLNCLISSFSNDTDKICFFFFVQLSRYSSMEGVLYCKPHYEQLFKESGSFTKNFQSRMLLYSSCFLLLLSI